MSSLPPYADRGFGSDDGRRGSPRRHRRAYPSCARAYLRRGVRARAHAARHQRLAAVRADEQRRIRAAARVRERRRRGAGPLDVAVAPLAERGDDRVQVRARLGQVVLEARRVLLVLPPLEDALLDQLLDARGEDVARGAGLALDLVEPVRAEEGLADHEQRPAIADDVQRSCDRADAGPVIHAQRLAQWVVFSNSPPYAPGSVGLRTKRRGGMARHWKVLIVVTAGAFLAN